MTLALIPQPKKLAEESGFLKLPRTISIGICCAKLYPAAKLAGEFFARAETHVSVPGTSDLLTLGIRRKLKPQEYRLKIDEQGVSLDGHCPEAVMYGLQTLRQIVEQSDGELPCLRIKDWPDFQDRGIYYDVCRGRVPKLAQLLELADHLARYKINQLQLYVEHTFAFRRHPKIGTGASPLTADDILTLDAYCAARGVELLPSLASFGHLATVLKYPEYRDMAEDWGVGRFVAPKDERPTWFATKGWTLSPANPRSYEFLDSLFAEFLPLFRSKRFNICCDETWDLGLGQSYEMCVNRGKGKVYLSHIKKVRKIAAKYGKKTLFWGDIIRHYPDLIKDIPSDVTVLDWGYGHNHPFARIKDFAKAGLPFYACPGTSAWVSLFPRLPEAMANIAGFAAAGAKNGALGLLTTDWGDGGHYNFMEYSWHGYLCGAEQGWNTEADLGSFTARFARDFLKSADKSLVKAITTLGDVSQLGGPYYQSIWQHVLFAAPDDPVLNHTEPIDMSVAVNGEILVVNQPFDAACGREYLKKLKKVRAVLDAQSRTRGVDPLGILPYWVFAVDTIAHAAAKLAVLGPGGDDTAAARKKLKSELRGLKRRFEKLWLARNRRSEIRITLKRYEGAIDAL